jgi:hypothetical protein
VSDLRSAIVATASTTPRRQPARWIDRLPDDVREELLTIRREWKAGTIQASGRGLAAAIVANCRERGLDICGFDGVREWLTRQD